MYYVYFLKSSNHNYRYTGFTTDIKKRLTQHNEGMSKATKPYCPFELEAYIAVKNEQTAKNLERYFKTGSGIAFSRKRLLVYEALAK